MTTEKCNRCEKILNKEAFIKKIYYDSYCGECTNNPNPTFLLMVVYILDHLNGSTKRFLGAFGFLVIVFTIFLTFFRTPLSMLCFILMVIDILFMAFMILMYVLKKSIISVFGLKIKNS